MKVPAPPNYTFLVIRAPSKTDLLGISGRVKLGLGGNLSSLPSRNIQTSFLKKKSASIRKKMFLN